MSTRTLLLLAALLVMFSAIGFAQQPAATQTINAYEQLAPFKTYYDSRAEWPRAHGFKPFKRYEWDVRQRGWPDGNVPWGAYWDALQQRERMPRVSLDETWVNIGPFNHGGRARVLRFHPGQPDTMYAGSVSGGLWKSVDAGESWLPMTDGLANLAVGCFEIDPSNPNIMYLGTGEGYYNIDAVTGIGLLKSTDGGATWNTTGLSYPYSQGESILRLNIDPRNGQIILAGTMNGLRRSIDGGTTWTSVRSGEIKELVRDPQNPDVLLCAPGNPWGANSNGIYRSTDNGVTWTRSSTGLPGIDQLGRTVLSFCRSNSQVVYAGICGTFDYNGTHTLGIYRSIDNGQSWVWMSPEEMNHYASQGWYDMAIACKPDNPNVVLSAGLDIHRSNNSGGSWTQLSDWWRSFGDSRYVHADHHEIVFHPTNSDEVWEVTDGGIFKSTNVGASWTEKNNGFVTFQYYAMGNATLDTALAYGGTQDNGTFRYHGNINHDEVFGGDGGYCVVDPTDDNTVYVEWQNGHRNRTDDGCLSFEDINPGIDGDGAWVTPMILDPFDPNTIYTTTTNGKVWRSLNQGRNSSWEQVGQNIGNGDLQVMSASPVMPGRLYVGSNDRAYRYDSISETWTTITGNLPGRYVTRVVPDPVAADIVYVTVSGFGSGHVYKSTAAGGTWQNISGNLPDVPFQDVVIDPVETSILYAGGDIGVYRTTNGGATWAVYGNGLPAVRVDDMELQTVTGVLRIATHGRGMWHVPTGGTQIAFLYPNGGESFSPGQTLEFRWSGVSFGGNVRLDINRSYPSAAWETILASTPNDGVQSWTVTGPESNHVRWRIQHLTVDGQTDTTNADTRIIMPGLHLTWPNGGETILTGIRDTVRFARTLVPEGLQFQINRSYPGGEWENISDTADDSTAFWIVRLPGAEHARARIISLTRPEYFDESDADFVIRAPQITLSSPSGGEELLAGTATTITWSAPEHQGNFRVTLNRDYPNGAWELIVPNTANDGELTWTPSEPASSHCRIRLATSFDTQTFAESAADFTITSLGATETPTVPSDFAVSEPFPNPFNPLAQISLSIPTRTHVNARVFNRLGQEVAKLADRDFDPGQYQLTFDGSALPSGIYFVRVTAFEETREFKAVLLK